MQMDADSLKSMFRYQFFHLYLVHVQLLPVAKSLYKIIQFCEETFSQTAPCSSKLKNCIKK